MVCVKQLCPLFPIKWVKTNQSHTLKNRERRVFFHTSHRIEKRIHNVTWDNCKTSQFRPEFGSQLFRAVLNNIIFFCLNLSSPHRVHRVYIKKCFKQTFFKTLIFFVLFLFCNRKEKIWSIMSFCRVKICSHFKL